MTVDKSNCTVLRASVGELVFDKDIDVPTRAVIREMWTNRLGGFHRRVIDEYLRDSNHATRHVIDGRKRSFKTFRRVCCVLLPLQQLGGLVGATLTAEVLDAHVTRDGPRLVTRCVAALMLAGRIFRQSRLTMTVVFRSGQPAWDEIIDEKIPRRSWPYARLRGAGGQTRFVQNTKCKTSVTPFLDRQSDGASVDRHSFDGVARD